MKLKAYNPNLILQFKILKINFPIQEDKLKTKLKKINWIFRKCSQNLVCIRKWLKIFLQQWITLKKLSDIIYCLFLFVSFCFFLFFIWLLFICLFQILFLSFIITEIKLNIIIPVLNKVSVQAHMKKGTQDKALKKCILDFCSMTSASQQQANYFLKRANWNIQNGINLFFDEGAKAQKKQIKENKQINDLFQNLSCENPKSGIKQIDEQKFGQFVSNFLKVDDENLVIAHILINIMKVPKSGHITKQHFYNLFQYLGCESPKGLIKYVKRLEDQIYLSQDNFKNMYINTYSFYLIGKDTSMEFDTALQIWKLYLKKVMPYYNQFITYSQTVAKKPNRVHKDLWRMVYQFSITVKNVHTVNEQDGWPVFLDDFIEYLKQSQKQIII